MYQILCKGICVENYIPKSQLQKALNEWKNSGMNGEFTTCKHSTNDLLKRIW